MTMKRRHLIFVTALIILGCLITILAFTGKIEAAETKETITCTVNGVERTLIWKDDGFVYFKIGDSEPVDIYYDESSLLSIKFDRFGSVWILSNLFTDSFTLIWWNYDFLPDMYLFNPIPRNTEEGEFGHVIDVESLILDDDGFIIGYRIFSGEEYAIPTPEDMRTILSLTEEEYLSYPQPRPLGAASDSTAKPSVTPTNGPTSSPLATPTASPTPTSVPTVAPTVVPTLNPTPIPTILPTAEPTPVPTTAPPVSKLIKKGAYTCLTVSDKVVSKYKLQKSTLTWTAASKKIKVKQVKKVGYTADGKCVYMNKKGQVGIISAKGKKKLLLKKGAKKLLFEKKFVVGVKTNKKKIKI